jgi:hypothetical protein
MSNWIYTTTSCFYVTYENLFSYGGPGYDSGWVGPADGPQIRIITEDCTNNEPPNSSYNS